MNNFLSFGRLFHGLYFLVEITKLFVNNFSMSEAKSGGSVLCPPNCLFYPNHIFSPSPMYTNLIDTYTIKDSGVQKVYLPPYRYTEKPDLNLIFLLLFASVFLSPHAEPQKSYC